jgi:hypothetical protein
MGKQLKTAVEVDGRWYKAGDRPGEEITDEDVEKIRNPKVWEYTDGTEPDRNPAKPVGAQLVKRVDVDGVWYGPGDEIPADVAAKIRNPKVWEGGKVPETATTENVAARDEPATTASGEQDRGGDAEGRAATADTAEQDDDSDAPARAGRRTRRS